MVLPEPLPVAAPDLPGLYDWPEPAWVRACIVMTLDGGLTGPDGLSGSISSRADRSVMAAIRSRADAYLVGAQTIRAEQYGPVRARSPHVGARVAAGQQPAPTLAIVSASCRFDWGSARFTDSDTRPVLLTVEGVDPALRAAAEEHCDVIVAGEARVEPSAAIAALAARGLTRITCEGGMGLLRDLIRADALDEVDLTLSPTLTAAPTAGSSGPAVLARMRLHALLEADGFLFARYLRVPA